MKRTFFTCAGPAVVGVALVLACRGGAQGPPASGMPNFEGAPRGASQPFLPTSPPLTARGGPGQHLVVPEEWQQPQENPDINRDLLVTPAAGPWLIYVHSYDDANGPSLARALTLELRGPNYGLQTYVWNYGDDERKAELERVRKQIEFQKEALKRAGLTADVPMRRPRMRIRVQCAVLVGGYKDMDAARRDLDRIKKLKQLDPVRFHLPDMFIVKTVGVPRPTGERAAVNPFLKAFPVRNPSIDFGKPQKDVQSYALLQRLNADESYNLLKCRKPWTMAVKQFQVPMVVESPGMPGTALHKGALGASGGQPDAAKHNAHSLADLLHRMGWEAYVLHTRFFSVVTVGSYDGMGDPRIAHDQEELAKLNQRLTNLPANLNLDLRLCEGVPIPIPSDKQ
jgi:hypothetical protein